MMNFFANDTSNSDCNTGPSGTQNQISQDLVNKNRRLPQMSIIQLETNQKECITKKHWLVKALKGLWVEE